jgi:pimeloyl-ACP methyl ester carboxylesterase
LIFDAALAGGCGLGVGIGAYLVVSFGLMVRYTERRAMSAHARELLREAFWVVLLQPIAPLWYVVGARMGRGRGSVPIVFVHGYMQNRVDFVWLARALRREHVGRMYGFNYPWMFGIRRNADRLARFVESVCREAAVDHVDLVCHSMGGLVACEYMHDAGHRVRRCVTIASPHAGITWRGPVIGRGAVELQRGSAYLAHVAQRKLSAPTLSIHSSHDNVVHPPLASKLAHRGGEDFVVEGRGHLAILFADETVSCIVRFLTSAVA